jgi:hypothetical protein
MIEIINYEKTEKNKVIGYVDIKLTCEQPTVWVLRKIAHLENQDKRWLNFPSFPKDQPDGSQKYFRYAELFVPQLNVNLLEHVHSELKKYLGKEKEGEPHLPF